jgi:hypothetical protein
MLKPLPVILLPVMETAALPVLESVTVVGELVLPTATLLKLTLEGLALSVPCVPVPLSAIVAGDPGALLVIEMLPEVLPADVGANVTVNARFAPALMLVGPRVML